MVKVESLSIVTVPAFALEPLKNEDGSYVKDADGNKLGYVPRVKNEILARLMDAGKLVFGRVKWKERVGDWVKVVVEVFLRD